MTKQPGVIYRPPVRVNGKIYPLKKPYLARPSVKGVQVYLGSFETPEQAREAVRSFQARQEDAA